MRLLTLVLVATIMVHSSVAFKILAIFPTMAKSHYFDGEALLKSLAADGHNITVISTYPQKTPIPNFEDYAVLGIKEATAIRMSKILGRSGQNIYQKIEVLFDMGLFITNFTMYHPRITEFLARRDQHFDLVICELFVNEAMLGFGQHFGAPVIGFSTIGASPATMDMVGSPAPLSYIPHFLLAKSNKLSFLERLENTLVVALDKFLYAGHIERMEKIYQDVFPGDNKPSLDQVRKNVSLVLLNQHFSTSFPQPYVPNMVDVGGIHINRAKAKPLPDKMRQFVEEATHGVVYFSMGSNIQSANLPNKIRDDLLSAFAKLKQRVLWKWEVPDLPGKPDNVMISSWFPQDDVLAHPNVKLFITHGGLLSSMEAIYHGVPIIGIPVFGDQTLNMLRAENAGYGVSIAFKNLTETSITWALDEMLEKDKYTIAAKTVSSRYRDQPLPPLELAKYWVNYIARHKGAPHLHSAGQDLTFVVYHSLDVFVFLASVVAFAIYFVYWLFGILIGLATPKAGKNKVNKKKQN